MQYINYVLGIIFLIIGIPIGEALAKMTQEELKSRQRWFKLIIIISLFGALISITFLNDVLLFCFAFIAIVTSKSLKK